MTVERRTLLRAYGAELVLTPGAEGMTGAIAKASELTEQIEGAFMPQQFKNPANPESTGAPPPKRSGTTPTARWTSSFPASAPAARSRASARCSRSASPRCRWWPVEPTDSPVLSGGKPGPHKIQGIGAGFVPEVLNTKVYDEVVQVTNDEAFAHARGWPTRASWWASRGRRRRGRRAGGAAAPRTRASWWSRCSATPASATCRRRCSASPRPRA